jgi:hypothetical protein
METTGTIKLIMQPEQVSDNFTKRNFVLTIGETTPYPQDILFQMNSKKCEELNSYSAGDQVTVHFNLRGRESKDGKYFNNLEAWKITA